MNYVKVTKIKPVDHPTHENSDFGESKPYHVGFFERFPVIGERFEAIGFDHKYTGITTTPVTEIINNYTFKTWNSVYKFEIIDSLFTLTATPAGRIIGGGK